MKLIGKMIKKYLGMLVLLTFTGIAYAGSPVCFEMGDEGIDIYSLGVGTVTEAAVIIQNGYGDAVIATMTFQSVGGLFPGATNLFLADTDKDTLVELVDYLNAMSSTTLGIGSGIVASLSDYAYEHNTSTGMTAVSSTSILGIANRTSLKNAGEKLGFTYIVPSTQYGLAITNMVVNAVFGSGTVLVKIYDGTSTDRKIREETVAATAVDHELKIPDNGDFSVGAGSSIRIDVFGTVPITSAIMNLTYKVKR